MGVADELCDELFTWIDQQERCADQLVALAMDLEKMRELMTAGQLVGNTATVLGSAVLLGTGIATFLTGGLAAPLLVVAGGAAVGVGTATTVTFTLVEKWKSSDTMKDAEKTIKKTGRIRDNIERLQKKLLEECESQGLNASSSDEVQCEITARILRAMAKRSGRDLPLSRLRRLLRSDDLYGRYRYHAGINPDIMFFQNVSVLLAVLGYSYFFLKTTAAKGAKGFGSLFATTGGMATLSLKTVLKGTGQVAGGIIGLVLTIPDLIDNCEELIKNKHETEASNCLRKKATEIREAVRELKKQLREIQEMLQQLPEMECHIDLAQEMLGSQIYTRGNICMEYKQTQKQDRKSWVQRYILFSTKDMGVSGDGSTSKRKSDDNKNKRQKSTSSTTDSKCGQVKQQRKRAIRKREPPTKSNTNVRGLHLRLPTITMSNVRSLPNKMKELSEMIEDDENFGDSDLMFFTETWLNRNSPSVSLEGYQSYRVDRDAQQTQKTRGGGLLMFVNEAWATDVEVENIRITPDYELMAVSIIPHDHPEGAPPLTFIQVYIPGPNFTLAANDIADFYYEALDRSDGGPVFLLGDFNQCDLSSVLHGLEQYVTCPTRISNTLDLCYGNVPGAYRSVCRSPLGRSDHNVIHLIPKDNNKSDKNDPSEDEKCSHGHTRPKSE